MGKDLIDILKNDFKAAALAKDTTKKNIVQMLRANIQNYIRDNKLTEETIKEEDIYVIMNKELKQQRDSLEAFENGNREDLASETREKIKILENYLPKQMNEDEIKEVIAKALNELNISQLTNKDRGVLMKNIMPKLKGKADGKLVNKIVEDLIQ